MKDIITCLNRKFQTPTTGADSYIPQFNFFDLNYNSNFIYP